MKNITTIFILIFSSLALKAQTVQESFQTGLDFHAQGNCGEALKHYEKALALKSDYQYVHYNIGACYQALGNYEEAVKHFKAENELAGPFSRAYYGLATSYVKLEKYDDAIANLDKTIALDSGVTEPYNLRGQLLMSKGDLAKACEDFRHSAELGDVNAEKFYLKQCSEDAKKEESLVFHFPLSEKWIKASAADEGGMTSIDYIREGESLDKWSELINLMILPGMTGVDLDQTMNMMFEQSKQRSGTAKITFIEKDSLALYPYIIFKIEAENFLNDEGPESQVWYITEGLKNVYFAFRAVKAPKITEQQKKKWAEFFKRSSFEYK